MPFAPFVASLLLVVRHLLLEAMPGAPSSVRMLLVAMSKRCYTSDHLEHLLMEASSLLAGLSSLIRWLVDLRFATDVTSDVEAWTTQRRGRELSTASLR